MRRLAGVTGLLGGWGAWVAWPALGGTAALLGGCGFKLRGAASMGFSRLQLVGVPATTPLGRELRQQLGGRVQLVDPLHRYRWCCAWKVHSVKRSSPA